MVTGARPDFFFRLSKDRGALAEVERAGTTTNNHDLKDFWKAHIASDPQHPFLIVPITNFKAAGNAREHPYKLVVHRIAASFGHPCREVDVVSAHVFD